MHYEETLFFICIINLIVWYIDCYLNNISNIGSYSENITINEEMLGVIVAPKATVYQAAGNLNGQIIANVAGNNGELHQVTVTAGIPEVPDVPDKPEPSEPPKPTVPDKPTIPDETDTTEIPEESEVTEIQEKEHKTERKNNEESKKNNTSKSVNVNKKWYAPKTGDNSIIYTYILIVLAVLYIILGVLSYLKKKK